MCGSRSLLAHPRPVRLMFGPVLIHEYHVHLLSAAFLPALPEDLLIDLLLRGPFTLAHALKALTELKPCAAPVCRLRPLDLATYLMPERHGRRGLVD